MSFTEAYDRNQRGLSSVRQQNLSYEKRFLYKSQKSLTTNKSSWILVTTRSRVSKAKSFTAEQNYLSLGVIYVGLTGDTFLLEKTVE